MIHFLLKLTEQRYLHPYLPNVFVGEVLSAVPTGVQALAQVNVTMLPHVVHCSVMLSAPGIQSAGNLEVKT